ncbi:TetR/AcrR family transcriptional regulator [Nocardia sp. NPDC058499]|uniref:TetR/AcrR family transcriptional regulator n=1 Tax=Nocardia sp. NPDC058499 TaxID=3346530 RepID=UPI00365F2CAE
MVSSHQKAISSVNVGDARSGQRPRRRAAMVSATLNVVMEGDGEAVLVREIADRAGVAVGTVYNYFGSKHQLLSAVAAALMRPSLDGLAAELRSVDDIPRKLSHVVAELLAGACAYRPLAVALLRAHASADATVCEFDEFEDLRRRIARVFTHCVTCSVPTRREREIGDLLFDVWATNMSALLNGRTTEEGVSRRVLSAGVLLGRPAFC